MKTMGHRVTLDTQSSSAFRRQARALLTLVPAWGGAPRLFDAGGVRVVMAEGVDCADGYALQDALLVRGDFQCGRGCRFAGPVYVGGECHVGRDTRIDALCVERGLALGLEAKVSRWADANGLMDLRPGAWAKHAFSEKGIQLALDAGAGSLFAPAILSHGGVPGLANQPAPGSLIEIPPPSSGEIPGLGAVRGFQPGKLTALGAETWLYDGSLSLPSPVYLRANMVVRGSFHCPPGSLLEADVKCGGTMRIGEGSIVHGRLTARGEMTLDRDCLFEGALDAGLTLRLARGVRGFRADGPVEAYAREKLILEPNVMVRGKLTCASGVRSAPPLIEGGLDLLLAQA